MTKIQNTLNELENITAELKQTGQMLSDEERTRLHNNPEFIEIWNDILANVKKIQDNLNDPPETNT
jgi:hypothetical protein